MQALYTTDWRRKRTTHQNTGRRIETFGDNAANDPEYNVGKFASARRRDVKKLTIMFAPTVLALAISVGGQDIPKPHMSPPPTSMNPDNVNQTPDTPTLQRHIDLAQLQKEANDLARTAQTIPLDLANVRGGTLPKDVLQKLKQIEKLSKHLRTELNP
jgi:hypothetical protein